MRYPPGHKDEMRGRIVEAVGRGFRRRGLDGIGVDGLAREAGVTSGAFYTYFDSKSEAFEEAAIAGLESLLAGIESFQVEKGDAWVEAFVDFYLGFKRTCHLDEACGLQALTQEVVRSDATVRGRYEQVLVRVVERVARGLQARRGAPSRKDRAWALLALLSGGVTMARATADASVGDEAAVALKRIALAIA
jgi:AcrR family transcriptional regulator